MIAAAKLLAAALLAAAAAGLKIEPSRGSGGSGPSRARDGPGTVGAARADKGFGSGGTSPANNKGFGGKPSSAQQQPDLSHLGPEWRKFQFAPNSRVRPLPRGPDTPPVPPSILRPDYAGDGRPKKKGSAVPWDIEVKTPQAIEGMVAAGRVAREVLDAAGRFVRPGVTTAQINQLVHEECVVRGAYPSPLNYHGFPRSVCTSVNEVICHGIPDATVLADGDLINVDVTVYFQGYHGDCSETFAAGEVDDEGLRLVQATYDCWAAAMDFCEPGRPYKEIGGIIENFVQQQGFTTVKEFCGHGVGSIFHTNPSILHYRNNEPQGVMAVGHTFTIEPMICEGANKVLHWPDDWTATTGDGSRTCQFEHTLLMTETGVVPLTGKVPGQSPLYPWERGEHYAGRGALSQATLQQVAQQASVYETNSGGGGSSGGGAAFGNAGRASLGRMDGLR